MLRFHQESSKVDYKDEKNAFAKHISNIHPMRDGDTIVIKIKVVKTFKKCLLHQVLEATAENWDHRADLWLFLEVSFQSYTIITNLKYSFFQNQALWRRLKDLQKLKLQIKMFVENISINGSKAIIVATINFLYSNN